MYLYTYIYIYIYTGCPRNVYDLSLETALQCNC